MASSAMPGQGGTRPVRNFYGIFISGAVEQSRIYMRHSRYSNKASSIFRRIRDRFAGKLRRKGDSMMSFALDFIFVAIGVAAFAVTALYLNACARL
jgi:hypothetical protein